MIIILKLILLCRDLGKSIELSHGKGTVACQSYTQRAMIKKFRGLEDEALVDFKAAAALGSQFAQSEVTKANPMAALCNAMLAKMMGELKGPAPTC